MNIRAKFFWIYDKLRNQSAVANHLKSIDSHMCGPNSGAFLFDKLNFLLEYTVENVPYYKGTNVNLSSFPIIDKAIIKSNIKDFISVSLKPNQLKKVVTSGSTGLPFQVYQDRGKVLRNTADAIFFGRLAGFDFGQALAYLKIWTSINSKTKFQQWKENILPIDVTKLTDSVVLDIVKDFKRKRRISILGYPSAIMELSNMIQLKFELLPFKVSSIITMSEGLETRAKHRLMETFSCKNIFSRYSNVENGIIAQQFPNGQELFLVNTASYIIEILDDCDNTLPEGEVGRIVVTDLYNFGMPMIRYDTGDIGSMITMENKSGIKKVLQRVEGRKMDSIYDTAGQLVSSFVITNQMWEYPELLQYQFIQLAQKEFLFKLNSPMRFEKEEELIQKFKGILGKDAKVEIKYVNEIPLLSSGKRKKVMNLTKENEHSD